MTVERKKEEEEDCALSSQPFSSFLTEVQTWKRKEKTEDSQLRTLPKEYLEHIQATDKVMCDP